MDKAVLLVSASFMYWQRERGGQPCGTASSGVGAAGGCVGVATLQTIPQNPWSACPVLISKTRRTGRLSWFC